MFEYFSYAYYQNAQLFNNFSHCITYIIVGKEFIITNKLFSWLILTFKFNINKYRAVVKIKIDFFLQRILVAYYLLINIKIKILIKKYNKTVINLYFIHTQTNLKMFI